MAETVANEAVGLSSPWATCAKKIMAMFKDDEEITVKFDETNYIVYIESVNTYKIDALMKLFKPSITFGNVTLKIEPKVINGDARKTLATRLKTAFSGNPIVSQIIEAPNPFGDEELYLLFKKEVIQFPNDDTSDYYGNFNGLAEDFARELFKNDVAVNIGTDIDK